MKARSYFLNLSTSVIILNSIVGLGAIFLVERLVPAIDQILEENAYSVSSALGMLEGISFDHTNEKEIKTREAQFWENFEKARKNVTLTQEGPLIAKIESVGKEYWNGRTEVKRDLIPLITELSNLNLKAMEKKDSEAQFLSLTGAWAVGLLLILSIGIQLALRRKIMTSLIHPVEKLEEVLRDYSGGNLLRRFAFQKDHLEDIKKIGTLLNEIFDSYTTNRKKDK